MGCINSKSELSEIRQSLFKVESISEDGTALWSAQLEISPTELTLYRRGIEPTKWELKHLRRYGYDGDLFTFEAGRRCTTGEGIYAFRSSHAQTLFEILRTYIEGIAASESSNLLSSQSEQNSGFDHISSAIHTLRQRQNIGRSIDDESDHRGYMNTASRTKSNQSASTPNGEATYLEPNPSQNPSGSRQRQSCQIRLGSVGSGPLSPEMESSDSLHSFTMIPEMIQQQKNCNLYQEFPVKSNEHNNNVCDKFCADTAPHETAPNFSIHSITSALRTPDGGDHMYVNVTPGDLDSIVSPTSKQASNTATPKISAQFFDDPLRSYVNLDVGEFRPQMIRNRYSKPDIFSKVELPSIWSSDKSEPTTPLSKQEARTVNYIVLDLGDQSPGSQPNSSLAITTVTSSAASQAEQDEETNIVAADTVGTAIGSKKISSAHMLTKSLSTGSGISTKSSALPNAFNNNSKAMISPQSPKTEPFGYATIDFNKTAALSNSTAPSMELDSKGARRTRHSSCVRQSNSISD